MSRASGLFFMLLGLAIGAPAFAQQDYPEPADRLNHAGRARRHDRSLARIFGARLTEVFKQQVVVDIARAQPA